MRELRLGEVEGQESYTFSPGASVLTARSGEIYVLDQGSQQVLAFSRTGRFVSKFGGRGAGPGEFQSPEYFGWLGDTLWVSDPVLLRTTMFRTDGSVIRTLPLATRVGASYAPRVPMALLADGSAVLSATAPAGMAATGQVARLPILRVDREGEVLDTLGWRSVERSSLRVVVGRTSFYLPQPWSDGELIAASPDGSGIVIVERRAASRRESAAFRITRLSPGGDTLFSRRYSYSPRPIPESWRSRWTTETGRAISENETGVDRQTIVSRLAAGVYVPGFMPPVTAVVAGRDGTVWIRREEAGGESVSWQVLDRRGGFEGYVRLPRDFVVHEADRSRIVGLEHDDLDVPFVVRYRWCNAGDADQTAGGTGARENRRPGDPGRRLRYVCRSSRQDQAAKVRSQRRMA